MKRTIAILFLCALTAVAAERAPSFTQARADAIAKRWQSTLRLNDWRIVVHIVGLDDLPDGAAAVSRANDDLHILSMAVLRPEDYGRLADLQGTAPLKGKAIVADIEDSILHELIHLRLRAFHEADAEHLRMAEEYTVVRLTEAFLSHGGRQ